MIISLNGAMSVNMFGCVTQKRGYWHRGRMVNSHVILYVQDGRLTMKIGAGEYTAREGDVMWIPRETLYKPLGSPGCTYYVFHANIGPVKEPAVAAPGLPALDQYCSGFTRVWGENADSAVSIDVVTRPKHKREIAEVFRRASQLELLHDGSQKPLLDLYFHEFLVWTYGTLSSKAPMGEVAEKAVSYIHNHIQEPLSLGSLAATLYLSESYIARVFKKELGETVGEYIQKQKIHLATALLTDTDMSVGEIARYIGFHSPYYFSSVFSKMMGMPPTAYRKTGE